MQTPWRSLKFRLMIAAFLMFAGHASISIAQTVGTFTVTGDMSVPRDFHSAVLLATGKVLIVGGEAPTPNGPAQTYRSAELYDPDTHTGSFLPVTASITAIK